MGKNRSKRRDACLFDSDDDDSFSSASTGISEQTLNQEGDRVTSRESDLDMFLDALYEKRGSTREKALVGLVDAFENHMLHEYVENKSITLFNQFLSSIKRGSSKEAALASRAISLLVLTIGCGSAAHEIMEESVRNLYQALMSGADSLKKSSILDCLAIVCFVGGEEVEEKEKAMKIIWELIHPKSGANVTLSKPNPVVLASAISAWTFILSTLNPRHMSSQTWRDSISYLSTLLEKEDRAVRIASGEAIALMFELGRLDKFSQEEKSTEGGFTYVETLKWKILGQARALSMEAGGKGTAKGDLNSQRSTFQDIVTFIETGSCPEHSMKISNNCNHLVVSSWTRMTQLHFLKRFLGRGFLKHVQENELLHDVFNFTPKKKDNLTVMEKRLFQSPNSVISKERTQYLNKKRTLTKDWKQGHFKVGAEDS